MCFNGLSPVICIVFSERGLMKTKTILAGVLSVAIGFGAGIGIPLISASGFEITSYEQAKSLLEDASTQDISETENLVATDDTEASQTDETVSEVNADVVSSGDDSEADGDIEDDENAVMLDWDYHDWTVGGVNCADSDKSKIMSSLGIDSSSVTYTDSGFEINYDGTELDDKIASVSYFYFEADTGSRVNVYYDGDKFVTKTLDDIPADVIVIGYLSISDLSDYDSSWILSYSYNTEFEKGKVLKDQLNLDHKGGITEQDVQEISKYISVPFASGNIDDMESVFKFKEMEEKGLINESVIDDDYKDYIVNTNLGKCRHIISNWVDSDGKKHIRYTLSFEDDKYECGASYIEGTDLIDHFWYEIKRPVE